MGYICSIETNFFMSKFLDVMSLVDCQLVLFRFSATKIHITLV